MIELNEVFRDNNRRLETMGAVQAARSGIDNGQTIDTGALKHDLVIDNLDREAGLKIAHGLSRTLDSPAAGEGGNTDLSLADLETSFNRSRDNEPVAFLGRPVNGRYSILLGEKSEEGKFTLQANINEVSDADSKEKYRRELNLGLISVLSQIRLEENPPVGESTEESVARVSVPVPRALGGLANFFRFEADQEADEHRQTARKNATHTLDLLGVAHFDTIGIDLVEFWESKNNDPIAVIDLFLYTVSDKQQPPINDKFPKVSLAELSSIRTSPLELRREQEKQAVDKFVKVGFNKNEIERRFQLCLTNLERLRLRFAAWMLEQPFMEACARDIRLALEDNKEMGSDALPEDALLSSLDMFTMICKQVIHAYEEHRQNRTIDGMPSYDMSRPHHVEAFNQKKDFLSTTAIMSAYILLNRDIRKKKRP